MSGIEIAAVWLLGIVLGVSITNMIYGIIESIRRKQNEQGKDD